MSYDEENWDYKVVRESHRDRLEAHVNGILSANVGWVLVGGVAITSLPDGTNEFFQTLLRRWTLRLKILRVWYQVRYWLKG